jgi:hypothetical protein
VKVNVVDGSPTPVYVLASDPVGQSWASSSQSNRLGATDWIAEESTKKAVPTRMLRRRIAIRL